MKKLEKIKQNNSTTNNNSFHSNHYNHYNDNKRKNYTNKTKIKTFNKKDKKLKLSKFYYFDNAASTKVLPDAAKAALKCMNQIFANPSSMHSLGLEAEKVINDTKQTLAQILNCDQSELIFTPSATISTNIAIFGSLNFKKLVKLKKTKILTTKIEHAATKNCMTQLRQQGFEIVEIPPKNKIYEAGSFIDQTDETTCLISIMHVNNENGLILPIEEITKNCKLKNKNVLIHLDCVQSFTKLPINLKKIPADFMSISGHKINGPKGIGALFIRKNSNLRPILFGGGQQNKLLPGTENVPAIAGFNVAAKFHNQHMKKHHLLYKTLQKKLIESCSKCNVISLNFEKNYNAPYINNLAIDGVRSQIMLNFLESKGFIVSSGSACTKGKTNNVLLNMGYDAKKQDCAIRISFSFDHTTADVEKLVNALILGAKTLKTASITKLWSKPFH